MAAVVFAAGAARAWYLPLNSEGVPSDGYDADFYALSTDNSPLEYPNNATNWANPFSAFDGAVWINTGSGPVLLTTAVNADLWVYDTDASWGSGGNGTGGANGWVEEARLLNSDGSAAGDFSSNIPGAFNGPAEELGVPGTSWKAYDNRGTATKGYGSDTTFQMELYLWTGTETTYAAALADGQYTADAVWTQTVLPAQYGMLSPKMPLEIDNPALVLEDLPGDANHDGRVDVNDLTVVLTDFGMTGADWAQGDFVGDGTVDINDLTILLTHFGDSIGSSAAGTAAVPEPGALALLLAGLVTLLGCARQRRVQERTA
jgi:hypothetical protein